MVAELVGAELDDRRLGPPDRPRDVGVVDQQDVGLEARLPEERPVLRDQVAAAGVVEEVGAEVRGLHREAGGAALIAGEGVARARAVGRQPPLAGADRVAAAGEAVDVELGRLARRLAGLGRLSRGASVGVAGRAAALGRGLVPAAAR